MRAKGRFYFIYPIGILLIIIAFLQPLLVPVFNGHAWAKLSYFDYRGDGWGDAYVYSVLLALSSTIISTMIGFFAAVSIETRNEANQRHLLALLILPLIGSQALSYMFKLDLALPIFDHVSMPVGRIGSFMVMLVTQCWGLAPLCIFLFSGQLTSLRREKSHILQAASATLGERVRDLYWPHCSNLACLLSLYSFSLCLTDSSAATLILRASVGTNTEVIGIRLQRYYSGFSSVDPIFAARITLEYCGLITTLSLFLGAFTVTLPRLGPVVSFFNGVIYWLARRKFSVGIVIVSLVPILGPLYFVRSLESFPWQTLCAASLLALLPLSCSMVISVAIGIAARIAFYDRLARFDAGSLPYFLALFSIRLVPPIAIVLSGFYWLGVFGYSSPAGVFGTWLIAECILLVPLIAAFVQFVHFRVPSHEVQFHLVSCSNFREAVRESFFSRFVSEYCLIALFGYAALLGEGSVNDALAFQIPSIAHELALRTSGRSGTYAQASLMIAVLLIPIICGTWLLSRSLEPRELKRA